MELDLGTTPKLFGSPFPDCSLSIDLIERLAEGNKDLITELEQQSAYVRRDSYINAYLIHPLFLEFLAIKQELLSEEQKKETYLIAGDWCKTNELLYISPFLWYSIFNIRLRLLCFLCM